MDYFEFKPMNKQEMIDYLGEMKNLEIKIPNLLNNAMESSESYDEIIQRYTFQHPSSDEGGMAPKGSASDKVYQTYLAAQRDKEREDKKVERYQAALNKLDFIKQCIKELPDDEEHLIIETYVKKIPYKEFASSMNLSLSWAYRIAKQSLDHLLKSYNSNPRFENMKGGEEI